MIAMPNSWNWKLVENKEMRWEKRNVHNLIEPIFYNRHKINTLIFENS